MIKVKLLKEQILAPVKYMYHVTSEDRVDSIMKSGLVVNSNKGKSLGTLEYLQQVYGIIPVFLSLYTKDDNQKGHYSDGVLLKINVSGLKLVADVGMLVEEGAYVEEDYIWFEEENTPYQLESYVGDNGEIYFEDLNTNKGLIKACIDVTKTAACKQSIAPDRIQVIGKV